MSRVESVSPKCLSTILYASLKFDNLQSINDFQNLFFMDQNAPNHNILLRNRKLKIHVVIQKCEELLKKHDNRKKTGKSL